MGSHLCVYARVRRGQHSASGQPTDGAGSPRTFGDGGSGRVALVPAPDVGRCCKWHGGTHSRGSACRGSGKHVYAVAAAKTARSGPPTPRDGDVGRRPYFFGLSLQTQALAASFLPTGARVGLCRATPLGCSVAAERPVHVRKRTPWQRRACTCTRSAERVEARHPSAARAETLVLLETWPGHR